MAGSERFGSQVMLATCVRRLILVGTRACLIRDFHGFAQSLHVDAGQYLDRVVAALFEIC